jgi:hypothetical protein
VLPAPKHGRDRLSSNEIIGPSAVPVDPCPQPRRPMVAAARRGRQRPPGGACSGNLHTTESDTSVPWLPAHNLGQWLAGCS